MTFKDGILAARHHLIFLLGLCAAFGLVIYLENTDITRQAFKVEVNENLPIREYSPLSAQELEWANIAWTYFENNTHEETGLVNSVDGYPAATMWDTASYLLGLISAERLGIVNKEKFNSRMKKALISLAALELHDGQLPHKSYNAKTLAMVDYNNNATERGIGWSALDIGRLFVPFNVIVWNYPELTPYIGEITKQWDIQAMVVDGVLYGAEVTELGETNYVQEGRIGYEEYAAKSVSLLGLDVSVAMMYNDFLQYESIAGVDIPTDKRIPEIYNAHNYVVSESYILDAIEFGGDAISKEFAFRVYQAQENRYLQQGILTAVSEDNIDQAPYFVYNTVFSNGKAWNAITDTGEDASEFRTVSTKAAFGWHMLYDTEYTNKLMELIGKNYIKGKGWRSGIYEIDGRANKAITANSNAIILESLHFKVNGPLLNISGPSRKEKLDVAMK